MALLEQKTMKTADILNEFRASFFAMSRLASFPWTVSMRRHAERNSRQTSFENMPVCALKLKMN